MKKLVGLIEFFAGYDEGVYHGEISVLAHEFTHGVNAHSGKLPNINESGALDESFADIFGFLVRRYATGSTSWEVGVPTANTRVRRNLQFPKTIGFHYDVSDDTLTITEETGQPDTYKGEFWFEYGNDRGGVHINSGVQNHWFYMLCNGEIGTNDIGNSYVVYGIGIEKSAEISYYNLTSNMDDESQYEDAMNGAIIAAGLKWGECSFEYIETQNAWYAAGVGEWSYCYGAGISDNEMSFSLYPNPTIDIVNIEFFTNESKTINVYSTTGQLLKSYSNITDNNYAIDISNLANGSYFVEVIGKKSHVSVFVKK